MHDSSFLFKGYKENIEKGEVLFEYELRKSQDKFNFSEKISFPPAKSAQIPADLLKSILDNFMIILGISYWKAYCPRKIIIPNNFLTEEQAEFWNIAYTRGLGEFFYKNKIDFRGLINFPYNEKVKVKPIRLSRKNRSLLGIGGGKDSIVAAEMLREQDKEFGLVTSGFPIQIEIVELIGRDVINTYREIDPKLLELNKEKSVYNGHIPISVYYAFLLLLMAALFDYRNIVVGNEKSADFGNVKYLGEMINHQWSKSEEFEKLFNEYVEKFITPDIAYFSPLRKMGELEVVEKFVKYSKYFRVFSSCNRNFKIKPLNLTQGHRWCGECPKCLFIFICLAAFLPKKEVLKIFGKNLLEDKNLLSLFQELIGIRDFKPFECVGTPEEVKEALRIIQVKGEFDNSILIKHFKSL